MGYAGTQFRMPLTDTGFRDDRNTQLLPPTALLIPSCNMNYHENGLSKRGGTVIKILQSGGLGPSTIGQGIFQFFTPSIQKLLFAVNGTMYHDSYSNVIHTGM